MKKIIEITKETGYQVMTGAELAELKKQLKARTQSRASKRLAERWAKKLNKEKI